MATMLTTAGLAPTRRLRLAVGEETENRFLHFMHGLNKYPGLGPDQGPDAGFGFSYSIGNGTRHLGCREQQLPREHPAWESKGSQTHLRPKRSGDLEQIA